MRERHSFALKPNIICICFCIAFHIAHGARAFKQSTVRTFLKAHTRRRSRSLSSPLTTRTREKKLPTSQIELAHPMLDKTFAHPFCVHKSVPCRAITAVVRCHLFACFPYLFWRLMGACVCVCVCVRTASSSHRVHYFVHTHTHSGRACELGALAECSVCMVLEPFLVCCVFGLYIAHAHMCWYIPSARASVG